LRSGPPTHGAGLAPGRRPQKISWRRRPSVAVREWRRLDLKSWRLSAAGVHRGFGSDKCLCQHIGFAGMLGPSLVCALRWVSLPCQRLCCGVFLDLGAGFSGESLDSLAGSGDNHCSHAAFLFCGGVDAHSIMVGAGQPAMWEFRAATSY
jgi:hypothetical protein